MLGIEHVEHGVTQDDLDVFEVVRRSKTRVNRRVVNVHWVGVAFFFQEVKRNHHASVIFDAGALPVPLLVILLAPQQVINFVSVPLNLVVDALVLS